jgi:hypothetical protein
VSAGAKERAKKSHAEKKAGALQNAGTPSRDAPHRTFCPCSLVPRQS